MSEEGVCMICGRPDGAGHEPQCYSGLRAGIGKSEAIEISPIETPLESAYRRIRDLELENRALNGKLQRFILVVEVALDNARQ
jgi:hypothetical protein